LRLITGANKGIGLETARQLGRLGIVILLGARDRERGRRAVETLCAEGVHARHIVLDVTDQSTIDAAAAQIEREFGKLDILVNNAGIFIEKQPAIRCEVENLRRTFETNFLRAFAVTKALLPLIRLSEAGRIVKPCQRPGFSRQYQRSRLGALRARLFRLRCLEGRHQRHDRCLGKDLAQHADQGELSRPRLHLHGHEPATPARRNPKMRRWFRCGSRRCRRMGRREATSTRNGPVSW